MFMGHLTAILQQGQSWLAGDVASAASSMDAIGTMRMAYAACTGARASPALMKIARMVRTNFMRTASTGASQVHFGCK
ncbi:MAG: hypothetical protein K2Y42_21155 [Hyphomicrobium sp.]|jgi:hypothetical protein|nr:hypothetical protein [Hyphomicrobium sp.]